ncbi:Uncharacterized conserved protein, DUF302 family [Aquimarina amphilecti]|uniref:Uncharacterized conserved protein, DUF302 family n=1 Tax=Aquimarina amphilecti TaxID=1038014 RepID=A0A1H7MS60_AQUAM|nr:DUF302 domain-containing protein [Aquimarina amphilecti]SEL13889.1 Uncharacterized conserved protein, DUF302 family [Aquimarina amphilecti]
MKRIVFCFVFCILLFSCNQVKKDTSNIAQPELEKQMKITPKQGIVIKESTKSFVETYNGLVAIIENNPNLKIIAQLDHQANAASVGLELNPTRIIMFGNPKLGTPLMQSAQTTGLDLPQKILVFQDDANVVKISYNDPKYLQQRHGIDDIEEVLNKISGALDKVTSAAAGL